MISLWRYSDRAYWLTHKLYQLHLYLALLLQLTPLEFHHDLWFQKNKGYHKVDRMLIGWVIFTGYQCVTETDRQNWYNSIMLCWCMIQTEYSNANFFSLATQLHSQMIQCSLHILYVPVHIGNKKVMVATEDVTMKAKRQQQYTQDCQQTHHLTLCQQQQQVHFHYITDIW